MKMASACGPRTASRRTTGSWPGFGACGRSRIPRSPLSQAGFPYWWIVEGDTILGAIALRHRLNDRLLRVLGQIGYGIRPSARRRGLATWALGQVLSTARTYGLDRVLIVCDAGNVASAGVIERQGGVLEDVRDSEYGRIRRYWVPLPV